MFDRNNPDDIAVLEKLAPMVAEQFIVPLGHLEPEHAARVAPGFLEWCELGGYRSCVDGRYVTFQYERFNPLTEEEEVTSFTPVTEEELADPSFDLSDTLETWWQEQHFRSDEEIFLEAWNEFLKEARF